MARKTATEGGSASGASLVMSVSLNLILLVFFVYINSIGANDEQKVKKGLGSLVGRFGILPGGAHLSEGDETLPPGPPIVSIDEAPVNMMEHFRNLMKREQLSDTVIISAKGADVILNLPEELLFPPGSADLRPNVAPILVGIAEILQRSNRPVRVEGHTDDVPIRTARFPSNWELSATRAVSVLKVLEGPGGIPKERLSAMGFAEHRPLVENDSPQKRGRNRRVHLVLVGEEDGQKK
jgi:chemotaxis protein MotB